MKLCGNFVGTASTGSNADFFDVFSYNHSCEREIRTGHKNRLLYYIVVTAKSK